MQFLIWDFPNPSLVSVQKTNVPYNGNQFGILSHSYVGFYMHSASYWARTRTEHVLNAEFHARTKFLAALPLFGFVLHHHACAVPRRRAQYSRQRSTPHHEVKFSSAHSHSTAVGNLRDSIRKSSLKDQIDRQGLLITFRQESRQTDNKMKVWITIVMGT